MLDRLFIKTTDWLYQYGERRRAIVASGFTRWRYIIVCLVGIAASITLLIGLLTHMGTQA